MEPWLRTNRPGPPDSEFAMTNLTGPSHVPDPVSSSLLDISSFSASPTGRLVVLVGGKFGSAS